MKTNVIPEQKQITVPEQVSTVDYFSVKAIINMELKGMVILESTNS